LQPVSAPVIFRLSDSGLRLSRDLRTTHLGIMEPSSLSACQHSCTAVDLFERPHMLCYLTSSCNYLLSAGEGHLRLFERAWAIQTLLSFVVQNGGWLGS
jgi:hypothetical protein